MGEGQLGEGVSWGAVEHLPGQLEKEGNRLRSAEAGAGAADLLRPLLGGQLLQAAESAVGTASSAESRTKAERRPKLACFFLPPPVYFVLCCWRDFSAAERLTGCCPSGTLRCRAEGPRPGTVANFFAQDDLS